MTRVSVTAVALFCVFGLVSSECDNGFDNVYDGVLDFSCPDGQYIYRWVSVHSNDREDRVSKLYCRDGGFVTTKCSWTDYVNNFDRPVNYECPSKQVMTGVASYHNNGPEDRRFKFKCCEIVTQPGKNCEWTNWKNSFDGQLDYTVPNGNAIVGQKSEHSNAQEDRRFAFKTCKFATCLASKIDILDDIQAEEAGSRVIGISTTQGCSDQSSYVLSLGATDDVTETTSVTIGKSSSNGWGFSSSVELTGNAAFLGVGGSMSMTTEASYGGSVTASREETKSTSTSTGSGSGLTVTFQGPGAGIIVGNVKMYLVKLDEVNVNVHVTCDDGTKFEERKTMTLTSKTFGKAHYSTSQGTYDDGKCNDETNACIRNVNGANAIDSVQTIKDFQECFQGRGTVSR